MEVIFKVLKEEYFESRIIPVKEREEKKSL
jgi:hypothetical protein